MRELFHRKVERTAIGTYALEGTDEDAEPRGVEEVDLLDVDDEAGVARIDGGHDRLAELGGGVDVDLAADLDDLEIALSA